MTHPTRFLCKTIPHESLRVLFMIQCLLFCNHFPITTYMPPSIASHISPTYLISCTHTNHTLPLQIDAPHHLKTMTLGHMVIPPHVCHHPHNRMQVITNLPTYYIQKFPIPMNICLMPLAFPHTSSPHYVTHDSHVTTLLLESYKPQACQLTICATMPHVNSPCLIPITPPQAITYHS